MASHVNPEEIFRGLLKEARPQQQRSLATLHKVLATRVTKKDMNFSIANIAKYSVAAGGPSESSIRNKTGHRFRVLIEAWAESVGTTRRMPVKGRSSKPPLDYELLLLIPDAAVRACFSQIIAERNRFESELNLLKSETRMVIDLRAPPRKSMSPVQVLPALSGLLNDMEVEALRAAIDAEFISSQGWRVTPAGQVKDDSGEVFKHGYATAIKKILDEVG